MDSKPIRKTEDDDLTSYFDKSATTVRDTLQRLENDVTRPVVENLLNAFRQHPIRSTYLIIFVALSMLPALSFIGFSLFVFTTFICAALTAALVTAMAIVALFGTYIRHCILFLGTLFLLFGVSLFLTTAILGVYLLVRLALLTYDAGPRAGVVQWAHESRKQLLPSRFQPAESHSAEVQPEPKRGGPSHEEVGAENIPVEGFTGSRVGGLAGNGAVGADLGSPPTVAKRELEKE
ncbi:uncharacterized protein C8Q71DRAFT_885978 [Rhodofomes roseus]|uniref:Promethin n=1 Tax=Rhodofomes roseus TaxID=34475 RepID=A0ABQ8K290_9APHY|nr:uncharacterized protein C8Q71DRAFT_885978 [Rhodofomes roseus]KAH9830625.1 hypothetical protein C8Q71DRAFT_885978 [Rhodofomes roseus]